MRGFADEEPFDGDPWDSPGSDADFALPEDTAGFEALGDIDLGAAGTISPLPPDDRLWRHPSELQFLTAPSEPVRGGIGIPVMAGIALGAGLIGALLAVASMRMTDDGPMVMVERRLETSAIGGLAVAFSSARPSIVDVATSVSPAVAMVETTRAGIETTASAVAFRTGGGTTALMTNTHVIEAADDIAVVLPDGRRFPAVLHGADTRTNIAVLSIEIDAVPVALLGDLQPIRVGEMVVIVGSPLALDDGPSEAGGVISGLGRTLEGPTGAHLVDLIQTDATVALASSGGALVDRRGAVVGITTAAVFEDSGGRGRAFATPIDVAYDVATDLLVHGRTQHAWIGITGSDADGGVGVQIVGVADDGPATSLDIDPGDVLVGFDGRDITSMSDLVSALIRTDPGDRITLSFADGRHLQIATGVRSDDLLGAQDRP